MFNSLKGLSDNLLLQQCKKGNEAAFKVLFRRYFDDLLQFATEQLKDQELAEEVVMNLLLKFRQKHDVEEIGHLRQYLFRILKNAVINHWKKKALSFSPLNDLPEYCAPLAQSADYNLSIQEAEKMYRNKPA